MLLVHALGLGAALAVLSLVPAALAQDTSCPLNFTAVGNADGSVTFHWSGFGGADGYQVFGHLALGNTAEYSPVLGGEARDFTQSNIAQGNYTFWVTAYHSGSVVASSCERTTQVGPQLAAPCPATVTALPSGNDIFVIWSRIDGATGYEVARSVDGGALVHDYGTVGQSNHPGFLDTNAQAGHTYSYRVVANNTRYPAEVCQPETLDLQGAQVPFFTGIGLGFGLIGALVGSILMLGRK